MGEAKKRRMAAPRLVGQASGPIDEARREFETMKARGDLVYERKCARCQQMTWGAIGGVSSSALKVSREEAEQILRTGRFVCSNCDPEGKQRWMIEVGTKLGLS